MLVSELNSVSIPALNLTDSVDFALGTMEDYKVEHLPLVNENKEIIAILPENELLEFDSNANLETFFNQTYQDFQPISVFFKTHVYEVLSLFARYEVSILPIIDKDRKYISALTYKSLVDALAHFFAAEEQGGILVLGLAEHNYSISEIGRIIESSGAKIINLAVSRNQENSAQLHISIKLNISDISRVASVFEKYKYEVIEVFYNIRDTHSIKKNFDALIHFLEI